MKKIKILVVLLFAAVFVSGCSCTSSMCSSQDLEAIKEEITKKYKGEDYKENDEINSQYELDLKQEALTKDITSEAAIKEYVDQNIEKKIKKEYENHPKACLTNVEMEDPQSGATISGKSWGEAWKEGLLEGLIVYPISLLLISFTNLFGGSGFAKVGSIIVTTIIIRLLMLLFTFKSQIQTQKMQSVQVEIGAISAKLKDPNLSEAEKNKLAMKMMEIYKKNGINPLASLLPTLISFPIFLSVWSAVNQTLAIRTGTFLGLELGGAVSSQVFDLNIGAIILFLLMSASQILSMKMPNILRNRKANYKNKEQIKEANKQMSLTSNIMIVMIIFTGFMLPAAIAVYWTVGAVISMIQTVVFQTEWFKYTVLRINNRKKKAKVVR